MTTNTKHTPGPWHTTVSGLSRYVEGRVRPGVLQEVAWCGATEVPEQMEANARLIAAAPELLEALNEINNWLVCACIATPDDMAQSFPHMLEVTQAALAKAGVL